MIDAAVALDRQDLREVAVTSANAVFTEVIESGFDLPHVHAYDVQSATAGTLLRWSYTTARLAESRTDLTTGG